MSAERSPGDLGDGVLRAGRYAWAALGVVVLTVLAGMALSYVGFVVVPLVLALFPAAALLPAVEWLVRRRVPRAVAALLVVLGVLAVLVGVIAGLVPLVADQVPAVADAVSRAAGQLEQTLRRLPFDVGVSSLRELATRVAGGGAGGMLGGTLSVTAGVVEFLAGTLLLLVALFCYLQDGPRMARSALGLLQERTRELVREIGCRAWVTLGGYFRGLLLVAAVDAVFIGAGLLLLGVPLALPLAALVFLGALFPVVGAVLATLLAALVALADGGFGLALAVLALAVAVEQLEGNVIYPLLMSRAVRPPPFLVLVAVAIGATALGVLGAFLAVPVAACLARTGAYLRERRAAAAAG